MLSPVYRYLSLDFETTGLDTQKDDIIQLWVCVFSEKGEVVEEFSSLIQPENTVDLKTITSYITWINESDIANAPTIKDIDHKFRSLFDENTIIIGQNIGFDIAFMERFFPDIIYHGSIDTYPWAKSLIHFVPSFALEVLCQYLSDNKELFIDIRKKLGMQEQQSNFHDALYDAKSAAALFLYMISHVHSILQTYPQALAILDKSQEQLFFQCIDISQYTIKTTVPAMPLLQKSVTTPQRMVKQEHTPELSQYPTGTQLYIGNKSNKEIATIIAQQKNVICVFSHKTKADIIKHHLHDMSVYGITSLYEETFFDAKRFALLMQKKSFTGEECNFLFKYLSHHLQWQGIIDIQEDYEKRIVYFLQERKPSSKSPIVFATHGSLYRHMKKYPDFYENYSIYFFDQDWRYISYNDFASHAYNPEYLLTMLEKIVYTYQVCYGSYPDKYKEKYATIQKFYSFAQIFVWVLLIDTQKLFTQSGGFIAHINPPLYHSGFYYTQKLRDQMLAWQKILTQTLPDTVMKDIDEHIDHLATLLETMVTIQRNDHQIYGLSFVYKETNRYIQRTEFEEYFQGYRVLFFSHFNKQFHALEEWNTTQILESERCSEKNIVDKILQLLQKNNTIFILSTQKHISQWLFQQLYDNWIHKTYTIVAENITGWSGKNIFLAKQGKKVVIIWWFSFFLQCLAKRLYLDKVLVFLIKWAMEKLLLCDIWWYGNQK